MAEPHAYVARNLRAGAEAYDVTNRVLVRNEFEAYALQRGASRYQFGPLAQVYRPSLTQALMAVGTPPIEIAIGPPTP